MHQGVLQSSPVQQMVAGAGNNWFSNNGTGSLLTALPPNHIPRHLTQPPTAPLSWPPSQELPHSWSQLVLGFAGEDEKAEINHMQLKSMDDWEQQLLNTSSITSAADSKQENTAVSYAYGAGNLEFTAAKSSNCLSASPPNSCVTTSSMRSDALGFSDKASENLMKCNSNNGGSKKPKINPTTSSQSGMKVRKEKLGDRITALHQIVSPFGKTDTASVLLEAIGYIRFLQRQIEALSLSYLSGNTTHQQQAAVKRERSCLFPEDPGQLLNETHRKRKAITTEECDEEAKKDLRSRGLCLVPLSCTVDFGSEHNGADYWAPAAFGGNFQ